MGAASLGTSALLLLLAAAGVAQVLQNLVLGAMVNRGLPPVSALALNSVVGLLLLTSINLALYGSSAIATLAQTLRWWYLLPGLLGTLVVFALLLGYARLGASIPAALVIAAQLGAAALLDAVGLSERTTPMGTANWVGLLLLMVGAALVLLPASR